MATSATTALPDALASLSLPTHKAKVALDDFVLYLLQHSPTIPCSLISNVYTEIVPQEKRFQIALDVVLPSFTSGTNAASRIASAYILYSLYTPYPIDINPFQSALLDQYQIYRLQSTSQSVPPATQNLQLLWVIWKILDDRGADLDSISPEQLATYSLSEADINDCLNLPSRYAPQLPTKAPPSTQSSAPTSSSNDGFAAADGMGPADYEEELSRAVTLLMTARLRVLTLSEIRLLKPHLATLVSPLPVLKAPDIPDLIAYNSTLARPLLVLLLREHPRDWSQYLDMLSSLPPTPSCFDVFGQLLQDGSILRSSDGENITVADLVRTEALGGFIHSCVEWIENNERDSRREGNEQIDDSLEKATTNLCRFYTSLVYLSVIDPSSDIENAEMAHFTLRHSQLEDANVLYRLLVVGRT